MVSVTEPQPFVAVMMNVFHPLAKFTVFEKAPFTKEKDVVGRPFTT